MFSENASGGEILSKKGRRSFSVTDKMIAAEFTTQTSFLSEMQFPLSFVDLEGWQSWQSASALNCLFLFF